MKIALTFSGGGFRAAAFALGSLSLLKCIRFGGNTLLDQVTVLSTVSGGTITGARFALGEARNESFDSIYESLYSFMSNSRLITEALDHLANEEKWTDDRVRNLITSFSDIYDQELFKGANFGQLMRENTETGLKHISFNATDFANGLQFRFQWSEKIIDPVAGESERGIIGNTFLRVPYDFARNIRLADIMAASSCFPGGFEPINFPNDFVFKRDSAILTDFEKYPIGLMDGGIVDNQGIEPVLLAESRMKKNRVGQHTDNVLDLIMICEVASPYMEGFKASNQNKTGWWKMLTPKKIGILNSIAWLLSLTGILLGYFFDSISMVMISTMIFTFSNLLWLVFKFVGNAMLASGIPEEFLAPMGKLLKLKLFIYQNLLMNRFNSVLLLTMNVFLKHVRRLNYRMLYSDKSWKNRRIMNAIYELKSDEKSLERKVSKGLLPQELMPSELMQRNSDLASSMGTTLWFTEEQLKRDRMLDAIVACGQYNTCWNLLEYIHLLKLDKQNTNSEHIRLMECEEELMILWKKFQANPKGMVMKAF
jgi:predicted acylesterase/phospholipase RssA